jgi:hypothetical protein
MEKGFHADLGDQPAEAISYAIKKGDHGLEIGIMLWGVRIYDIAGEYAQHFTSKMEQLLIEYEQAAFALDIEEGNHA